MTIKTKLDIGEQVFFIFDKKVIESVIRKIQVEVSNNAPNAEAGEVNIIFNVLYLCNKQDDKQINVKVEEQHAFRSKAELLKSL